MEIVISLIVCFLAVYGVFKLLCAISFLVLDEKNVRAEFIHELVAVNDDSENIEGYIRAKEAKEERRELIILDYSKKEETKMLLSILEKEFSFVRVMNNAEYIDYISRI